ncbi:MAG: phosphatase [Sphingobacteriaceae bacterium]|nr:phosphatase [Sphingobacteriaceae bacterium]
MKIAVIDLGTNTFNLLIVETDNIGGYKKISSNRIPVKLGEGTINKGFIAEVPFSRGIEALKVYSKIIKEQNIEKVVALATSAIRTAKNGLDFVEKAESEAGISVEVIDGNREAELIYFGNRKAVQMSNELSLIMDIGGGSTEFIIANKDTILWKQSFLLGAARLLELVHPSDPITESEIKKLFSHFDEQLIHLHEAIKEHTPLELIGSSGAFDSIVDMMAGEYNTEALTDKKTEYNIDLEKYFPLSQTIIASTYNQRLKTKGLIEMRVDMIVISCLFVNYILNKFSLKKLRVSTYSLKEGVIFNIK